MRVDVSTVSYLHDPHDQVYIDDFVENAVITLP